MPSQTFTGCERKWTVSKPIEIIDNGLVNDINYYKSVPSGRDYVVATFAHFELHVNEIRQSDFESLNNTHWLTGFVVSVLLNILNFNKQFQVVEEVICSRLFSDSSYSDYFLQNAKLN